METLYILELEDNKWYVGKSADVAKRFEQHKRGVGSAWTKTYSPVRIAETRPIRSGLDETNVTKELMKKYGVENVRGGAYTAIALSTDQEALIRHELRASSDSCYKCGQKGHFANRCDAAVEYVYACGECNREFKTRAQAEACRCSITPPQYHNKKSVSGNCYRCGRKGHWASSCYAKTDVRGNELESDDSDYNSE